MAKANKNETETQAKPETDAPVTDSTEAVDQPETVESLLSAQDELAKAKEAYETLAADLKEKIKTENKTVALDLVTEAADELIPALVFAVGRRGQRLNTATIRYNGKAEANEQIKIITSAVRMSAAEFEAFKVANKAEIDAAIADETGDDSEVVDADDNA